MKILKKIVIYIMIISLLFILTGCSKDKNEENTNTTIGVDEGLLKVEITVPAEFLEGKTQEELTGIAIENGYESITLNEDGSATYKMTKSQHKKMLKEMADGFNQALDEMVGSEDYPNFTEIKTNDNFTDFTIRTKSTELDFTESFSILGFYMYGGMYNIYSGEEVDNIHVKFVNDSTGVVISESNSKDLAETEESNSVE